MALWCVFNLVSVFLVQCICFKVMSPNVRWNSKVEEAAWICVMNNERLCIHISKSIQLILLQSGIYIEYNLS